MAQTLIDSHCHFDFDAFDTQRESIWQACKQLGIQKLIIPAVAPANSVGAFTIADTFTGIYSSAGLHPWWVSRWLQGNSADDLDRQLRPFLTHPRCVAVGECGLDGLIDTSLEQQQPLFDRQLQLACKADLPVIVHVRKAHNQVLELLKRYRRHYGKKCRGVIHGFSGSIELAQSYWDMGFYLGIGGTITYPRASKTRRAVAQMPLEALLLETDAPDMPLSGRQGEINSPLCLPEIAQCLAELRGVDVGAIHHQTSVNSKQIFHIS